MTIKITLGMRIWCRRLMNADVCKWTKRERYSINVGSMGVGSYGRPSWVMVDKMEVAGLIEWVQSPINQHFQYHAVLTEVGNKIGYKL